jgi:cell division protein FtsN
MTGPPARRHAQQGGFLVGLIVGLLVGLGLSLAVALYVTKVPVPFINKVPQRSVEQEASQAEKNRNWDPNAPLASKPAAQAPASAAATTPAPAPKAPPATAAPAPAPPAVKADAAASAPEAFTYFVQAGAYSRSEDAEQQRANLALLGMAAKITEREQAGRTMYRVRLGPFERKDEAEAAKERLGAAGVVSALVRVQR